MELNLVFSRCVDFIPEWLFTENKLPFLSTQFCGVGGLSKDGTLVQGNFARAPVVECLP